MKQRGKFISLEGGEGCGKSTQISRIASFLSSRGIEAVLTREPGGTPLCEHIRHLLKDQDEDAPCPRAELLLFLASRAQLVKNVIEPALAAGKWVVSDRFSDSTLAYQGYGRKIDIETIRSLDAFARASLQPDCTFLLDLDEATSVERRLARESSTSTSADRFERAASEFHSRVRAGFLAEAARDPKRFVVIDASKSIDEVWNGIWTYLTRMI